MSFFISFIDKIRGINQQHKTRIQSRAYIYGVILSGTYANWKTDSHPTFFCLGTYSKNGSIYVHGIQLHNLNVNLQWFLNTILTFKNSGAVSTPLQFFNYLKMNAPLIIKNCYRTYKIEYCNFKIVSSGLTNINNFYKSEDSRDYFLNQLTPVTSKPKIVDLSALRENITNALNTFKIW